MSFTPILDNLPVDVLNEEKRRPTNVCWVFPFGFAVIAFVAFGVLASFSAGPAGIVSDGFQPNVEGKSQCGIDSDVLDKTLRMIMNDSWICVKSCPQGSFDASTCATSNFGELKRQLVCQDDKVKTGVEDCNQMQIAVKQNECVGKYQDTYELFGVCVSSSLPHLSDTKEIDIRYIEAEFGEITLSLFPSFLYAIVIAGVLSFIFTIILQWCAAAVFWTFVGLIISGMIVLIITLFINLSEAPDAFLCNIIVLSVALLIFCLFLFCLRRKIRCGIEIVKESSYCVCASFRSMLFPVFPLLLRAGVLIATIYIIVIASTLRTNHYQVVRQDDTCVCSNKLYANGDVCTPEQFNMDCHGSNGGICPKTACKIFSQSDSDLTMPWIWVTIILATWIVAFIQAHAKMILAHVYGNWYWTGNRQYIPNGAVFTATKIIMYNHTGTAAFGGFVVMVCRIFKSLLRQRGRSHVNNVVGLITRLIVELISCLAYKIIDLIQFVSDKAFVVSAIMGYGFWDAVQTVSKIMVRDIPLVVATEHVGDIILFACKFVAAALSAGLFYVTSPFKGDQINVTYIAAALIFWFAFDLAAVLLTSYNVAIDTLLICTIQDFMHNGEEKPYFKSQVLNGLLIEKKPDVV